ncbi:hypothetical protein FRB90_002121, partial [Tulasnella sp. 427]
MSAKLRNEIESRIKHVDAHLLRSKHHGYRFYKSLSDKFEPLKASYTTIVSQTSKSTLWSSLASRIPGSSSGREQLNALNRELTELQYSLPDLNYLAQNLLDEVSYQPLAPGFDKVIARTCRQVLSDQHPKVFGAESLEGTLLVFKEVARVPLPDLTLAELDKQNSERRKWSTLQHPNILAIIGTTDVYGGYCLVSKFVPNGNVVDYLRKQPEAPVLRLIRDTAAAVKYLHATCNMVHGDIKPSNILVTAQGQALLCDFATVKRSGDDSSSNSRRCKSTVYLSPEILDYSELRRTKASDMWAFGISVAQIVKRASSPWSNGETNYEQMRQTVVVDDVRPTPPAQFSDPKEAEACLKTSYYTLVHQSVKSKRWSLGVLAPWSSSGGSSIRAQRDLLNKELKNLERSLPDLNTLAQERLRPAPYRPLDPYLRPIEARTCRQPLSVHDRANFAAESPEGTLLVFKEVDRVPLRDLTSTELDIRKSERAKWSTVQHPNILAVLGTADFQGEYCLVSELVPNGNIVEHCRKHPKAPVLGLIRDTAAAVEYLHVQLDFVHGNIKPSNILVTADGRALLCDFATVKQSRDDSLHASKKRRSTMYLSPEILDCSTLRKTKASDMWAFGISVAQ